MKLDKWQEEVLATKGNMCIVSPRQMGKSTVISEDAGEYALKNSNKSVMIIASVERQALLLFEKVLSYIYLKDKKQIKTKKDKPTKHELKLKNGSIIRCLPTGDSGYGIRGYTIDRLYADEAAFIKEDVWAAVTPMLATTGGDIILLSTPFGKENYFYRMSENKKFTLIHVDPEKVIAGRNDLQRVSMTQFRKDEKERMTKLQYQQEHMGLFVGGIQRFFPDEMIDKCCLMKRGEYKARGDKFQGVDVARMGGDDTVLISVDRVNKEILYQIDMEITNHTYLTETARLIIHKDKTMDHKRIYIDTTGMGWGVFDICKEDEQTKRKVIAIENVKKSLDRERDKDKDTRKKTFKEDLYNNLLNLMREGNVELYDEPEIRQSLRSIQYENQDGQLKIYGNYSHIAEALIRAAWCMKDKTLGVWIR